ncbi:nucleoside phosphorylase protein [Rhizobium phaseoli]|uniref:5'-methylthioadenosine/S-adenosylhomocysteine nucleosidase family protein n=1 Tax=Rhizobium phaseoli TaxID=396 RepID=UPI0007EA22B0|nr:hypothetical protein [Rhizobium phaseoli]ANL72620.1 nucleoside phosphorylase protein [Rhizobium phaseoli]
MSAYLANTSRPVFLSFINREVTLLRGLSWSSTELTKFIKTCCTLSDGIVYAPFAQTQEMLSKDKENVLLISELCSFKKINLINAENDFNTFLDGRRDMYGDLKTKYSCYFGKTQPLRNYYTKSPNLRTSEYIKGELLHLTRDTSLANWLTFEDVVRIRSQKSFIQNELQEKKYAATFSLYEISRIEPKPQEVRFLGDISSKLFKRHYADSHDMITPTGLLNDPLMEDYEYYPYFDINVNYHLISSLQLDKIIVNPEYKTAFVGFVTHKDFHHFINIKNRYLNIISKIIKCTPDSRKDSSLYFGYLRHLKEEGKLGYQNFDPVIYCESITATIQRLNKTNSSFAAAMDESDRIAMSRKNIFIFTATDAEDEIFRSEILNFGFQHVGSRRAGDYFYTTYSLFDTIHLHHMRTFMGSGNVGGSQRVSHEVFNSLSPDFVISAGICFGANAKKQKLGDLVVGESVRMYELAAARDGRFQFRGPSVPLHPLIPSYARNAVQPGSSYSIHVGAVLSGEKLVDDVHFKDRIMAMDEKAVGGEMEAAGIVTSSLTKGIPFGLIKGICDWGESKNDDAQELAAQNAIRFSLQMICDIWGKR